MFTDYKYRVCFAICQSFNEVSEADYHATEAQRMKKALPLLSVNQKCNSRQ